MELNRDLLFPTARLTETMEPLDEDSSMQDFSSMAVERGASEAVDRMADVASGRPVAFSPSDRTSQRMRPPSMTVTAANNPQPTIDEEKAVSGELVRMTSTLTDKDMAMMKTLSHQPMAVKKINTDRPLLVKESSTVMCLRRSRRSSPSESMFSKTDFSVGQRIEDRFSQNLLFDDTDKLVLDGTWEVLLAQSECQNNLKSTKTKIVPMRFAGEWKLAGGMRDEGETPEQAARRELSEEYCIQLPEDESQIKFRLMECVQTPPMQSKSDIIYCYVAVADENPWLENLNVEAANQTLEGKREVFRGMLETGEYWAKSFHEKEQYSPEIYELRWLDMAEAVKHMYTSMGNESVFVNSWQQQEFERLNLQHRDPMLFTMYMLLEVDTFPDLAQIIAYTEGKIEADELAKNQWLRPGMTPQEVARELKVKLMTSDKWNLMFRSCQDRALLMKERRRAAS